MSSTLIVSEPPTDTDNPLKTADEPKKKQVVDLDCRFSIRVVIDEPPVRLCQNMINEFASPTAKVTDIRVNLSNRQDLSDDDDYFGAYEDRQMPPELFPVFESGKDFGADDIPDILREYQSTFGMSLYDFFAKMIAHEKEKRSHPDNTWFGGPDTHHVFYEGGPPDGCHFGS